MTDFWFFKFYLLYSASRIAYQMMKDLIKSVFRNSILEFFLFFPILKALLSSNKEYKPNSIRRVVRNGIRYELDLSEYMEHAVYFNSSIEERSQLNSCIIKDMVVFDIGANIGDTTLNFAKLVGAKGKVYSFEPVDITYAKLRKNISLNRFSTISTFQIALSDKEEKLMFGYSWNNNSSGIQMNKQGAHLSPVTNNQVNACTLDGFVTEHGVGKIDFIKIDVEGFESYVLKGAEVSIRQFSPIMYLEVSDRALRLQNSSAEQLMRLVASLGYSMKDARTGRHIVFDKDYTGIHMDILCMPKNSN